jgi:protein gp37
MARRLQGMGQPRYARGFEVACHPDALGLPLEWHRPQMIFVNSMSDLFHEAVPEQFIRQVFDVMSEACWHHFQVLTKRAERLRELAPSLPWPENVWAGVSVESADFAHRIAELRRVPAAVRFVSFEPLLAPVGVLDLSHVGWVIAGGESGPGARPMAPEWVSDIRDQCVRAGVPFFFKQWGGFAKKRTGRVLEGRTWDQYPASRYTRAARVVTR